MVWKPTFQRRLSEFRSLLYARQLLASLRERGKRRRVNLRAVTQTLSPLFVLGSNRSGSSLVSSILGQHPELEGLFDGPLAPAYDDAGHAQGYCESLHLWPILSPSERRRRTQQELPFWSLPNYVSEGYRRKVCNDRERFDLAWAIQRQRQTEQTPLINDHYNMFRTGLIVDLFPRTRFLLVTRPWRDFLKSGIHKWSRDGMQTALTAARPRGGMHWHLVNLIARYDLESFAPGRYAEVWLDVIQQGAEPARKAFESCLRQLNLAPFDFDFTLMEPTWQKRSKEPSQNGTREHDFSWVPQIVEFERQLLREAGCP